ncbi:MAG: hypothetical protein Q7T49_01695 [bacterium]|nr:hypothetical protein [bacterium]
MFKNNYPNNQAGFALLYAVLLTGIILTVGLGLSSILTKQIVLSSIGSNSQVAYYAANTAKECVFFWGFNGGTATNPPGNPPVDGESNTAFGGYVFDDELNDYIFIEPDSPNDIVCGGNTVEVNLIEYNSNDKKFQVGPNAGFNIIVPSDSTDKNKEVACAKVIVTMNKPTTSPGKTLPESIVEATGYNLDCSQINNTRRVERSIRRSGEFSRPF